MNLMQERKWMAGVRLAFTTRIGERGLASVLQTIRAVSKLQVLRSDGK
jgi:hypothetical protein